MTAELLPSCPLCHALIGHKGHVCRVTRPNWGAPPEPPPVTDPDEVAERIAACRAALASTAPPPARPAGRVDLFRERPLV